jgi:hypothetical protein
MIRQIAKWYISRSLDHEKPIPLWVRYWIRRDRELQMFADRSVELASRLRHDASEWTTDHQRTLLPKSLPSITHSTQAGIGSDSTKSQLVWHWSLATAAVLIAIIALYSRPWSNRGTDAQQIVHIGSNDRSNGGNAQILGEEKRKLGSDLLAATFKTSSRLIQQINAQQMNQDIESFTSRNLVTQKDLLKAWPLSKSIESSTSVAASATSNVLLSLNDGMRTEQLQLIDDLKKAADYFSRKLPQRAVKLVGLDLH